VMLLHIFAATPCPGGEFLGFPKWYKYLNGVTDKNGLCSPQLSSISDIWLIVAAFIEALLRLAAIAAIVFVIYGGIQYVTSQGDPAKTAQARSTIINALVGLIIAVGAITGVTFVAGRFT
jgi:hypothetical protein